MTQLGQKLQAGVEWGAIIVRSGASSSVTVQTGGLVALHADGDIDLQAGRTTSETDSATQSTQRKLLSKTTTTTAETRYESLSQGSRIEGGIVSITANGAITGEGVLLQSDDGVLVQAGGPLDLHEARDIRHERMEVGIGEAHQERERRCIAEAVDALAARIAINIRARTVTPLN